MKRARMLLLAGMIAAGSLFAAAPAHASCQTNPDVGDWCKVRDAAVNAICSQKVGGYLEMCQS